MEESIKITAEMIPLIRASRDLCQAEFAFYAGISQARLSDIETGKIPISEHYENAIKVAILRLHVNSKELASIKELLTMKQKRGVTNGS